MYSIQFEQSVRDGINAILHDDYPGSEYCMQSTYIVAICIQASDVHRANLSKQVGGGSTRTSPSQQPIEPHVHVESEQQANTHAHCPPHTPCSPFKEQRCAPRALRDPRSSAVTPPTAPATTPTPLLPAALRASAYVYTRKNQHSSDRACV